MRNLNRVTTRSISQPETPELLDDEIEDYTISAQLDRTKYVGQLDKDFGLDRDIHEVRQRNIELYTKRLEEGLEIFSGEPLSDVDLCAVRGYGGISFGSAMNRIRQEDKLNYELDHE